MRIFYSKCKFSQLIFFPYFFWVNPFLYPRVPNKKRSYLTIRKREKWGGGQSWWPTLFQREREREISFLAKQPSLSLFSLSLSNHLVVKSNNNLLERIELLLFPRKIERDGRNDFSNFIFHFVKFVKFAFANVSFLFNRKTLRGGIEIILSIYHFQILTLKENMKWFIKIFKGIII